MTDAVLTRPARPGWLNWLINLAALVGIGAPFAAVAMALLTGSDLLAWQTSLGALRPLNYAAMAGGGLALIAIIALLLRKDWSGIWLPLATVLIAGAFVMTLAYNFGKAATVPPIHDVTTDLENPPEFQTLSLREDNLETVPPGVDPRMEALDEAMRWRLYHVEAYADIQPITVPTTVPETVEAARTLVEERGWDLAAADAASGRVEATDTVSIYRFKDDVVLRITPNPNGEGSVVNMRSVSRVGVSDLGVNAERIRAFLADLQARLG